MSIPVDIISELESDLERRVTSRIKNMRLMLSKSGATYEFWREFGELLEVRDRLDTASETWGLAPLTAEVRRAE